MPTLSSSSLTNQLINRRRTRCGSPRSRCTQSWPLRNKLCLMTDEHDVYAVVRRLLGLRDWLRTGPQDFPTIVSHMPGDYVDDENGKRQFRRDLRNLQALGYTIKRHQRPLRWSLSTSAHLLADEDVQTLVHIREAFGENHPLAP